VIHHLTRVTRHLLFWLLVSAAVGSIVVRILLTAVDNYKSEFEQQFYQLTHIQLQIGSLRAGTRGFNPEIIFRDIDILSVDKAGKPAVQLKEVRVGIDVLELLFSRDLLSSSWLALVGLKISVIRQEDGSFTIKGLNDNNEQPLWLVRGGKYEILQSEISWQDKKRQGETVIFNNFDLLVRNDLEHHEIHLLTGLPEQYGDSLTISAVIDGNILTGDNIAGSMYLEGDNIDFTGIGAEYLPFQVDFTSGQGSFKFWSEWRDSQLYQVTGSINGEGIKIERGDNKTLALDRLDSYLSWSCLRDGWQFSAHDLRAEAGQQQWPAADFSLSVSRDSRISVLIHQLDLQEVSYFAPFFLDTDQQSKLPKELKMAGVLQDFSVYATEDLQQFALNGSFSDIAISSTDTMTWLQGVSGQVHGSQKQGRLIFDSKSGSLFFPDLFRTAIDFQHVAGTVNWQQSQQSWRLNSDYLVVENTDFKAYSRFDIQIPETDQPVFIELQTVFESSNDVTQVAQYLPAKIMDAEVVDWLDHAFVKGHIYNGNLLLSGHLNEFPFSEGQGKFEVMFAVDGGILNYHPDWPLLEKLNAEVHFFADNLRVNIKHAHSEQLTVRQAVVDIPELSEANWILVDGLISGSITDGLLFMQKTPLHTSVDGVLATANFQGKTKVDLKLKIPLTEMLETKVDGVVHVNNSRMIMKSPALPIEQLRGDLYFTGQGVFCKRMDGKTLGFPVQANIKTEQGVTRISVNGKSNMHNLQQQFPFLRNDFIQGGFSYIVSIDLPLAESELSTLKLDTNLQGVKVALPEELAKSRKQKKPLQLSMQLSGGDVMPVWLNYNNQLKIALRINKQTETVHSGHIVYGSGQAVAGPENSLKLSVRQPILDVAAWTDFNSGDADKLAGELPKLNEIHVSLGQLQWGTQQLGELELAVKRKDQYWQGSLVSPVAQGNIRIPLASLDNKKIHLQMTRLDLSKLSELNLPVNSFGNNNKQIPLIDIFSDQLLWQGIDLGRLELKTERFTDGIHFSKIKLTGRDSDIDMTADWFQQKTGGITELKGHLTSNDFGRFLGRLGYNDDLIDTIASIDFNGSWRGAPYQFSLTELVGQVQVKLDDGRISSIEPGFGRLLGLIAMEQWVKRFTLDFSDIYKKGLAFNSITGKFSISDGLALSDDLTIDAIPARVKIAGQADLLEKMLDYRVLVVPKSSAAVPIAGTIVGGIAAVITQVFTDDYKEGYFFGSEYKVKGSWENVEITPLHDRDGLLKKTWQDLTDFPWLKSGAN